MFSMSLVYIEVARNASADRVAGARSPRICNNTRRQSVSWFVTRGPYEHVRTLKRSALTPRPRPMRVNLGAVNFT